MTPLTDTSAIRQLLQRLSEKFTIPLLSALAERPHRYNEIRRRLGVTSKSLSRVLRVLETEGFIERLESPSLHLQVNYDLTSKGASLLQVLDGVGEWLARHRHVVAEDVRAEDRPRRTCTTPTRDSGATLQRSPLTSAAVVVTDIDRAARSYATALGLPVPPIVAVRLGFPPKLDVEVRQCWFRLSNFWIGLIQPVASAPHERFLDVFGERVFNLGFETAGRVHEHIGALQKSGGRCSLDGSGFALFEFGEAAGTTFGIVEQPWQRDACMSGVEDAAVNALARHRLTHVGIVVPDIAETARWYAEALGLAVSPVRSVDVALPPGAGRSTSRAKVAHLRQRGMPIKLIEPVDASPLHDFLDEYGGGVHHVGINAGETFHQALTQLREWGGTQILGRTTCGYAVLDCMPRLGLDIEISGTPAHHP